MPRIAFLFCASAAGQYNETVFRAIDYMLAQTARFNLKVPRNSASSPRRNLRTGLLLLGRCTQCSLIGLQHFPIRRSVNVVCMLVVRGSDAPAAGTRTLNSLMHLQVVLSIIDNWQVPDAKGAVRRRCPCMIGNVWFRT